MPDVNKSRPKGVAVTGALKLGTSRLARGKSSFGTVFKFSEQQMQMLDEIVNKMRWSRNHAINTAIRYALLLTSGVEPANLARRKDYPRDLSGEEFGEVITAETELFLSRCNLNDRVRELAVMGVSLLHKNLKLKDLQAPI